MKRVTPVQRKRKLAPKNKRTPRKRIYQLCPDTEPSVIKKNNGVINSLTEDEKALIFSVLVEAAADIGFDGNGFDGFAGYIEKNVTQMTDESLKELSRMNDPIVRGYIQDEIKRRDARSQMLWSNM